MNEFIILYFVGMPFFFGGILWVHRNDKKLNFVSYVLLGIAIAIVWPFSIVGCTMRYYQQIERIYSDD